MKNEDNNSNHNEEEKEVKARTATDATDAADDDNNIEVVLSKPPSPKNKKKKDNMEESWSGNGSATSVTFDGSFQDSGTLVVSEEDDDDDVELQEQQQEQEATKTKEAGTAKDKKEDPAATSSCLSHPRIQELYLTADWWSLWIGLATFAVAMAAVFVVPLENLESVREVIPQPQSWQRNPLEAWNTYNLVGIPILMLIFLSFYLACQYWMGKLEAEVQDQDRDSPTTPSTRTSMTKVWETVQAFGTMSLLAVLALWLGSNDWASEHGLGYAVFAILIGMLVGNILGPEQLPWLFHGAKDGEFFIKCSLTLLAVELDILVSVGAMAMVVAWIGSPLAIVAGYWLGKRLFNCKDSLSLLIAVGASWCGASAISAVAPVISATSEEVSLSIGVVSFFTVIFTFAQPYFAMAVNMPDDVAGAWIGGRYVFVLLLDGKVAATPSYYRPLSYFFSSPFLTVDLQC